MGGFLIFLKKRWWILILGAALIAVAAAAGFWLYFNSLYSHVEQGEIDTSDEALGIGSEFSSGVTESSSYYFEDSRGITQVALFGVDVFEGFKGRSDVILIVTIDRYREKIKMTSIVRDSYVNIPGYGMDKITHAYSFGGPELALKTLNSNFGLNIRYYAAANFTTLPKIVDRLGGLTLTVTDAEASKIPFLTKGGTYLLRGDQVIEFARIRKIDSDYERTRRHRDILKAMLERLSAVPVLEYGRLAEDILPNVKTNLSALDALNIWAAVKLFGDVEIEQRRFPADEAGGGQLINGIYYFVFDIPGTREAMGRYLYLDEE